MKVPTQAELLRRIMENRRFEATDLRDAFNPPANDLPGWDKWTQRVLAGEEELAIVHLEGLRKKWDLTPNEFFLLSFQSDGIKPPQQSGPRAMLILKALTDENLPEAFRQQLELKLDNVAEHVLNQRLALLSNTLGS